MRSFQKFSERGKARLPGSSKLLADAGFLLDEANLLAEVALEGATRLAAADGNARYPQRMHPIG
jgi:hypothetical protein